MTRRFSKSDYNKYDGALREVIVKLLNAGGNFVINNETKGVDLKSLEISWHELETKKAWVGDWPIDWKDVRIPLRKIKYIQMAEKAKTSLYYWVASEDHSQAWRIPGFIAKLYGRSVKVKVAPTYEEEEFVSVPIDMCDLINLKECIT